MTSRRGVPVTDASRWVFNRLARDYRRRPGYPPPLVARLLALAGGPRARVADLGAGTGHLAIPLARLGAEVHAVEPARAMLDVLAEEAGALPVRAVHAAAEETGLAASVFDLVLLADALQWVEPERAGREVRRLLAPGGSLAVVVPVLADAPFLRALRERIARANPKARPRPPPVALLASSAGLPPPREERFLDEVLLDDGALAAVVRSLSYAGPALGPAALESLLADARALARAHGGAVWRREILLHVASRPRRGAGRSG
jgi:SAM-dependent methyltransferase